MKARKFTTRKQSASKIPTNPVIVLIVEGHNVTETLYFRQYNKPHTGYILKILASGSSTDPEGMLANLDRFWKENDLDRIRMGGIIIGNNARKGSI